MSNKANAELFNRASAPFGGHFDPSNGSAVFERALNMATGILRSLERELPDLPKIHFGFLNDDSANAVAFKFEGEYFIGVNIGTIATLHTLFDSLLSARRNFPRIGNPSLEDDIITRVIHFDDSGRLMATAFRDGYLLRPRDKTRQRFSLLLFDFAFGFLLLHEAAHIAHGHVDLYMASTGVSAIHERQVVTSHNIDNLIRQMIELDADWRAATVSLSILLRLVDAPPSASSNKEYYREFFSDWGTALYAWSVAIHAFFRLFGDEPFSEHTLEDSLYPPLRVRQYCATSISYEFLMGRQRDDLVAETFTITPASMKETEEAFSRVTGTPLSFDGITRALELWVVKHIAQLQAIWRDELRQRLLPHARCRLAPSESKIANEFERLKVAFDGSDDQKVREKWS